MTEGSEPLADEERVFRRVPDNDQFIEDFVARIPSPSAFRPHPERDKDGLSLLREKYVRSPEAAAARPGKSTYLARLRVGDVRGIGLDVIPDPPPPEHCNVPRLNARTAKESWALEAQKTLAHRLSTLLGPFPQPHEADPFHRAS
jgi:hypothetical protein